MIFKLHMWIINKEKLKLGRQVTVKYMFSNSSTIVTRKIQDHRLMSNGFMHNCHHLNGMNIPGIHIKILLNCILLT